MSLDTRVRFYCMYGNMGLFTILIESVAETQRQIMSESEGDRTKAYKGSNDRAKQNVLTVDEKHQQQQ